MIVSETIILWVFVGIIFISAGVAWWMGSYANYDATAFHTFISILIGLSIFVTIILNYNVIALQNEQVNANKINNFTSITDLNYNVIIKMMRESVLIVPNFVLSLNPLMEQNAPVDPNTPAANVEKSTLSYRLFSMWQDAVILKNFIGVAGLGFFVEALQRANSQQLYNEWQFQYINFDAKTVSLVDMFFRYALPITNQVPQSYVDAAEQMEQDPEFKEIFGDAVPKANSDELFK